MAENEEQSNEEQIGFHKGSLSTLSKERAELNRILSIVEQLMQMHIASLKELGVDLEKEADELMEGKGKSEAERNKSKRAPIEDIL